ncbi:MAG TPA: hypothetical protein VKX17_12500 [Planctomycetota bacterium]|nr:hypothetical protein [Planctomycetota bacterium]
MPELIIPQPLARWIQAHMPGAPDLRRVRIFCGPRIPFDWLPGFRKKYIGITLWGRIHLREPFDFETPGKIELLFHELVHVRQFNAHPLWFPISYLLKFVVKGYRNHPAEIEAREVAAELWRKYSGKRFET